MSKGRSYQNNSNRNSTGHGRQQHNSFGIIQDTYEPETIEEEQQGSQEI
jgi:hypothetical protein